MCLGHDLPESHSELCTNGKERSPWVALAEVFAAPVVRMLMGLPDARWSVPPKVVIRDALIGKGLSLPSGPEKLPSSGVKLI